MRPSVGVKDGSASGMILDGMCKISESKDL